MGDIRGFLRTCFGENEVPSELNSFLSYVSNLKFDALPDYDRCRNIFRDGLKKRKIPLDGKVDFSLPKSPTKKPRNVNATPESGAKKRKKSVERAKPSPAKKAKSPLKVSKETSAKKRKTPDEKRYADQACQTSPAFVKAAREARKAGKGAKKAKVVTPKAKASEPALDNPTPTMLALMEKRKKQQQDKKAKK